jgi:hypothetical protein
MITTAKDSLGRLAHLSIEKVVVFCIDHNDSSRACTKETQEGGFCVGSMIMVGELYFKAYSSKLT